MGVLDGQIALITGASRGIGRAIALGAIYPELCAGPKDQRILEPLAFEIVEQVLIGP